MDFWALIAAGVTGLLHTWPAPVALIRLKANLDPNQLIPTRDQVPGPQFHPPEMPRSWGLTKPYAGVMLTLRFNFNYISFPDSRKKFILWREYESEGRT